MATHDTHILLHARGEQSWQGARGMGHGGSNSICKREPKTGTTCVCRDAGREFSWWKSTDQEASSCVWDVLCIEDLLFGERYIKELGWMASWFWKSHHQHQHTHSTKSLYSTLLCSTTSHTLHNVHRRPHLLQGLHAFQHHHQRCQQPQKLRRHQNSSSLAPYHPDLRPCCRRQQPGEAPQKVSRQLQGRRCHHSAAPSHVSAVNA